MDVLLQHAALGMKRLIKTYEGTNAVDVLMKCHQLLINGAVSPLINARQKYNKRDITTVLSMLESCLNANTIEKQKEIKQLLIDFTMLC